MSSDPWEKLNKSVSKQKVKTSWAQNITGTRCKLGSLSFSYLVHYVLLVLGINETE